MDAPFGPLGQRHNISVRNITAPRSSRAMFSSRIFTVCGSPATSAPVFAADFAKLAREAEPQSVVSVAATPNGFGRGGMVCRRERDVLR
jgi:hypothetical protein